jgi:hypothetical protein
MKRKIVAALLCVPFAASSETLLVEYHGTVSSIDRGVSAAAPSYSVGDAISGTLVIDATLAPPDELVRDPTLGRYAYDGRGAGFILGPSRPPGFQPGSGDLLLVYDDWLAPSSGAATLSALDAAAPQDGFFLRDRSIGVDGEFDLVLGMTRPTLLGQLFTNDGLVQSFDVERETGVDLWGYVADGFGELWRSVNFTLDRFSVRPGVCRA